MSGVETRCLSSCVIETGDVKTRSQTDWMEETLDNECCHFYIDLMAYHESQVLL